MTTHHCCHHCVDIPFKSFWFSKILQANHWYRYQWLWRTMKRAMMGADITANEMFFPGTENKSWRAKQPHCQKQINTTQGRIKVEIFSDNVCGWYKHIYYVWRHPHPSAWTKHEYMMQKIHFDQKPKHSGTNNKSTLESFSQIRDLLCSWTFKLFQNPLLI